MKKRTTPNGTHTMQSTIPRMEARMIKRWAMLLVVATVAFAAACSDDTATGNGGNTNTDNNGDLDAGGNNGGLDAGDNNGGSNNATNNGNNNGNNGDDRLALGEICNVLRDAFGKYKEPKIL